MRISHLFTRKSAGEVAGYLALAWRRYSGDKCMRVAASLSYTSLLAIVPLCAIAFAMFAAFPMFEGVREQLMGMVFDNLLPDSASSIRTHIDSFIGNTAEMTGAGIAGLGVTAVLLLNTIETALNSIFRVTSPRPLIPRILVFWALITFGPILLGASLSLATYLYALKQWVPLDGVSTPSILLGAVPTLIVILALAMLYVIVPNRRVDPIGALIGATVAGALFGVVRKLFGLYMASGPTYQTIYGAVAVVPFFLVWMYVSWALVLFGAVMASVYGEWKTGGTARGRMLESNEQLAAALHILAILLDATRDGGGAPRKRLRLETGLSDENLDRMLAILTKHQFVERTRGPDWVLVKDLERVSLYELVKILGLDLDADVITQDTDWARGLSEILATAEGTRREQMSLQIKELLNPTG